MPDFNDGDLIEVTHLKQYSGEAYYGGSSTGTASAYLVSLSPPPLSGYPSGSVVNFKPHIDNAASPTLNVNGLGAKSILKNGVTPLAAADIKNGQLVSVVYDGINFHLLAVAASGGSAVAALTDLTDVTLASPATGQVLRKSAGDWVNSAIQASDLPAHNHDGAQIITGQVAAARLSSNAPGATQFLRGDGTWANAPAAGNLDSLTDVVITAPVAAQVLRNNGAQWVNAPIAATDMPSAIDAANIGSGLVSNTEFGFLDGVSSAIQTQINGKAASVHPHAASDITSGQLALAQGGTGVSLVATGGPGEFLKQSSAGAVVTVGVLAATDMPSAIDAAKIGSGLVSNTEFGYLDGVTSPIQAQMSKFGSLIKLMFGDGSDGSVTISANTSLTEPKFYDNLTVNSGVSLNLQGFPIYVKGTLTLNGTIHSDGSDAYYTAAGVGGGNQSLGSTPNRWSGNNGGNASGGSTPFDYGALFTANGGNGGTGVGTAGSGTNSMSTYTARWLQGISTLFSGLSDGSILNLSSLNSFMAKRLRGGLGGGAGAYGPNATSSGAGGGGGGVVRVFAQSLAGSGTIAARGGSGGVAGGAGAGGGGGGAGGAVILVSASISHSYTLTATGGSGIGGGAAGSNGFTKFIGGN